MNLLQVELAKAKKRITKAVRKHIECDNVTVGHDAWGIHIHVWQDSDIIASVHTEQPNDTTNQVVQRVHKELGRKFVVTDDMIPF